MYRLAGPDAPSRTADGVVTKQEQSANFWDCSDPYVTVQVQGIRRLYILERSEALSRHFILELLGQLHS